MTDHQALARAVLADPIDPAPRLALADLLDEAGDEARAASLRRPGRLTWDDGRPWASVSVWWHPEGGGPVTRLLLIPDPDADPPPHCPCGQCGSHNRVHIFGRWWCWPAASRQASRMTAPPHAPDYGPWT